MAPSLWAFGHHLQTVPGATTNRFASLLFLAFGVAGMHAHSQEAVATLGKQRAAASRLQWEIKEANHPLLGPIRFAYLKTPITTAVGSVKISSRAYVSCEKSSQKIAIELAHGATANDPNGLPPKTVPRLLCNKAFPANSKKSELDELSARWGINELGDVLARGLQPSLLRQCASISVEQDVALPVAPATARVKFEISPYGKELDSIFVTCGEVSAYGPASTASRTSAPPAATAQPPAATAPAAAAPAAAAPSAPVAETGWKTARTVSGGRTNVRASPSTSAALVVQLEAGAAVLVQKQGGDEWWRAKAAAGKAFEGYIREDRLIVK